MPLSPPPTPVIFLAYANERTEKGFLRALSVELKMVLDALETSIQENRCQLKVVPAVTQYDIQKVFQDKWYDKRVSIFHYGGHSDEDELWLETTDGGNRSFFSIGLSKFLGAQKGIQLVFLNGCGNEQQAQLLLEANIPVVIATSRKINDDQARRFAEVFYHGIAQGESIQEAFDEAEAIILGDQGAHAFQRAADTHRSLFWDTPLNDLEKEPLDLPWKLFSKNANNALPTKWRLFQSAAELGESINLEARILVGKTIGPYRLDSVIGEGAAGLIYRVTHIGLNEVRVMKITHRITAGYDRLQSIMRTGYKGLSSINHPNVARVYDQGETPEIGNNRLYVAMELVPGVRLDKYDLIGEIKAMGSSEPLLQLALSLASGLKAAHETIFTDDNGIPRIGIYHGNLKRRKVIFDANMVPKMIDFTFTDLTRHPDVHMDVPETALLKEKSEDLTDYFPPEVLSGQSPINAQTDIYGLGALLIESISGLTHSELSFSSPGDLYEIMESKGVRISRKMSTILYLASHPNPKIRYKRASDMLQDLQKISTWWGKLWYRVRKRRK